jgi:hypothetical protein
LTFIKLGLFLLGLIIGFLLAIPVAAQAPFQPNNDDYTSGNLVIKDDAIQQPLSLQGENSRPTNRERARGTIRPSAMPSVGSYSGRHYSKDEVIQLIKDYSAQYDISAEVPLCIAKWESGYNQLSKNKNSSASGVFQYLNGTWAGTDEGKSGHSVFDANSNIKAAIKYMASRKSTQPWEVRNKCPKL